MIEKQYYPSGQSPAKASAFGASNEQVLDIFNELIINKFCLNLKFEQKEMTTYLNELNDHVIEISDEDNPIDNDDLKTLEFKLLNLISNSSLKNYKFLCNIGQIIKSANCFKNPYSIWVDLCKRANSRNYEIFKTFKPTSYTIKFIHYFAKQDDIQRYHTLMRLHNIPERAPPAKASLPGSQADEQIVADTLNIDRRYLLDKDKYLGDQNIKQFAIQ